MAGLIQSEVVVAPLGHPRVPFQHIGRQIEVAEFDLLLDGFGELVVHGRHQGRAGHQGVVLGFGTGVPGVGAGGVRTPAAGGDRLLTLPVGQRAAARIAGDQVDQMRRSGARHTDDDQWPLDLDVCDLGIAREQVVQRQPVAKQPNDSAAQGVTTELAQTGIGLDGRDVCTQTIIETPLPEVAAGIVDTGLGDRLGLHLLEVEHHLPGFGVVEDLPLDVGQHGIGQIVEIDHLFAPSPGP